MSERRNLWGDKQQKDALSSHIVFESAGTELDRQWAQIGPRIGARRSPRPWFAYAAVAVAALVLGVVLHRTLAPATVASFEGTIESGPDGQIVKLSDGAEIRLGRVTALRIASFTRDRALLELERGEVTLDVPRGGGRSWVVAAGGYEVRVVGTRFAVRRERSPEADSVSVEVLRGQVEVGRRESRDPPRKLEAGESWRVDDGARAAASMNPPRAPATPAAPPSAQEPEQRASAEPDASASAAPPAPPPSWEELAKAGRARDAYALLGADGFSRLVESATPEKLFRLAELARMAGQLQQAARAFDTLRRKHRGDSRAGLAAFELGRLRLDSLGSPAGAAEALADAIALSPGAPFREDAEARRVQALHVSGSSACAAARDAYLARYPQGAHAAVVRARCGYP